MVDYIDHQSLAVELTTVQHPSAAIVPRVGRQCVVTVGWENLKGSDPGRHDRNAFPIQP